MYVCMYVFVYNKGHFSNIFLLSFTEAQRQKRLISARGVPLSQEELQRVRSILIGPETHEVLIDKYAIDMTRAKILCLRPCTWLNDEVINFYMNMLMERDQRRSDESAGKIRSSHFFSSFFMVKLLQNGRYTYANVKRWTKKFDVFQKDKIFIPVNINNAHWTLLIVYIQKNEIHYYDSMSGRGKEYTKAVMKVRILYMYVQYVCMYYVCMYVCFTRLIGTYYIY